MKQIFSDILGSFRQFFTKETIIKQFFIKE